MYANSALRQGLRHLNSSLSSIDALFAAHPTVRPPPPLFIIGPPRSGTTLTYQVITQHFRVGYMTAPLGYVYGLVNMLTRLLRPWLGRPAQRFDSEYGRIRGVFSPSENAHYWFKWFPEDGELGHYVVPERVIPDAYEELRRGLDSLADILGRPMVFKNLYLTMAAGALARILPEARFILVHRDPVMVCQSVMLGRNQQANPQNWWSIKPPHYREWLTLPVWQQVVRQVYYSDALPRHDLQRYAPDRTLELEYIELCRQPHACLHRLEEWLGPAGYQIYRDSRVPPGFPVSAQLSLDPACVTRIRGELTQLEEQFVASFT